MRKYLPCIFILVLAINFTYAQKNNNSILLGTIVDASTKRPLEGALVTIDFEGTKKSTISSDEGIFKFIQLIPNKEYWLKISALGYKEHSSILKLSSGQNEFIISLMDTATILKNVEIRSTVNKVIFEPGKTIFRISEEEIKNSTNALSLLNKIPYVSISGSKDVKIKGHIPAQILLDGKVVNNTILESLSIKNIEKVEIVSNPSGSIGNEKDDGIVNIITKKNWDGYFGTIGIGIGTNENYSPSFSFSTKGRKLETNIYFSLNHYNNKFNSIANWFIPGSTKSYSQSNSGRNEGTIPYLNVGLNYQLDSSSTISYLFWTTPLKYVNLRNSEYDIINTGSKLLDYYLNSKGESRYLVMSNSIDFVRKIRNSKNSYSLSTKYYRYLGKGIIAQQQIGNNNNELQTLQNNKETLDEYSLQFSYNLNSLKKIAFTMGAKYINRRNKSAFIQSVFDTLSNSFIANNNLNTGNNFMGTENILGIYVSTTKKIKKLNLNIGLRYEYTHDDNNYYTVSMQRHYGSLIPNITGNIELSKKSAFNFSYARRIYRPGVVYLNPYVNALDPRNLLQGNSNLQAEKRDRYEIEYVYTNGKYYFSISPYFYTMTNQITRITSVHDRDTLISTYNNIGKNKTMGFSISDRIPIFKNILFNSSAGIERNSLSNDSLSRKGNNFYLTASISIPIKNGLSFEESYQYSSSSINIQGENPAISSINLSINKKVKDKFLIQVSVSDFLSPNFHRTYIVSTSNINRIEKINFHSTIYMIKFNYNFGKTKNRTYINSRINNSDLKN